MPQTYWSYEDVGHTQDAKKESIALFAENGFSTPKPEHLIKRVLNLATNPGDLVLDSFLGSGTTAAVAHKMGRRYIGIEMGSHAYTHCKVRLDKIIAGEDPGGITKSAKWEKGGGYRFYELAPTLINEDAFGEAVINPDSMTSSWRRWMWRPSVSESQTLSHFATIVRTQRDSLCAAVWPRWYPEGNKPQSIANAAVSKTCGRCAPSGEFRTTESGR